MERPADVEWLVQSWRKRGEIGSLTQLMEDNVAARLRERGGRRRSSHLTAEDVAFAARGAALHATLAREPRFWLDGTTATSIDAVQAFPGLSAAKIADFLGRGIFADDAPGLRRIHHRTTEEYLAAIELGRALGAQAGGFALEDFLVRARYGVRVVPPSLRGVAVWAAGRSAPLRRALTAADPLLLVSGGDPAATPPEERPAILAAALAALRASPGRRSDADRTDLSRFACVEIEALVRSSLPGSAGSARDILLRLVRLGPLPGCAAVAMRLAVDPRTADGDASLAARAAAAAGDPALRARLVGLVTAGPAPRTDLLFSVADELYPEAMGTLTLGAGLRTWARSRVPDRHDRSNWSWMLARQYDPALQEALIAEIGPALLAASAIPRHGAGGDAAISLAHLLEGLMERRLRDGVPGGGVLASWAPWVWALARTAEALDVRQTLRRGAGEIIGAAEVRRAVLAWLVASRADARTRADRPWSVFRDESMALAPRAGNAPWILEALAAAPTTARRRAWLDLAYRVATSDHLPAIDAAGLAHPELVAEVRARQAPVEAPAWEAEHRAEAERLEAERAERERLNRERLVADVDALAAGTHDGALRFLAGRMGEEATSRWGQADWRSLDRADELDPSPEVPLPQHRRKNPNSVEWQVPAIYSSSGRSSKQLPPLPGRSDPPPPETSHRVSAHQRE